MLSAFIATYWTVKLEVIIKGLILLMASFRVVFMEKIMRQNSYVLHVLFNAT